MRLLDSAMLLLLGMATACSSHIDLQCEQNSNCDLAGGGVCLDPGTGNHWCAYPDGSCPNGLRYSDVQVGDDVSGICVTSSIPPIETPKPDNAAPTEFSSCKGLAATCGASDDCCNSPLVSGGTFYRSYDVAGDSDSGTATYAATVADFRFDKYEVTVGRFRKFVEAGMGTQASPPTAGSGAHATMATSGWKVSWNSQLVADKATLVNALKCDAESYNNWTDAQGALENRPINCLTWYEAMAFCIWDGGYLPTEAEWNYAAAGGDQQRAYPWSTPASSLTLDSSRATYYDGSPCGGPSATPCPGAIDVGSNPLGNGRFGQSDLAGNVDEPVLDSLNGVGDPVYQSPCVDCALIKDGDDFRRRRGGSARDLKHFLRTGSRDFIVAKNRTRNSGVRCAHAP
jgi:formylglycine-generating enzyme